MFATFQNVPKHIIVDGDQAAAVSHVSATTPAGAKIEVDVMNYFRLKGGFIAYMSNYHDPGPVRDRVFQIIESHDLYVDALILEKAKALPGIRSTEERFYQYAWYYLMKYVAPRTPAKELLVVSASVGSKKKRRLAFYSGVQDVIRQVGRITCRTACWDAGSDACLQVADYCGWAIQRKWESGDASAYHRIATKIRSEFDLWARGTTLYY